MQAFDTASSSFSSILTTLRSDFLICDFFQPRAPALALSLNIPTVQFVVSAIRQILLQFMPSRSQSVHFVQEPFAEDDKKTEITEWLNKRDPCSSVIYVAFGSENYLSKEDREELALGLFLSNVNITWVLRFPRGTGEHLRKKARELSDCIRDRACQEIDMVVNDLVHLVGRKTHNPF
ncbi:hypothetical protein NC651_019441 [Populus alba x Populus x berolinensis]|nr:hypothetical protein NC651_019441 [Populus alba x Populus x berolinensis]